jgi:hypothetical protein
VAKGPVVRSESSKSEKAKNGCDGKFADVFDKYLILKGLKRTYLRHARG